MIICYGLALVLLTIVCIYIYKKSNGGVKKEMEENGKIKKKMTEYYVSGTTLKDGTCKLFETDKGKIAVCRDKDKIRIFAIDESKD